ncbi:putative leader peptide [Amycolatopsis arida]|nr:putative leader peptide [Amycolatopsis arida]
MRTRARIADPRLVTGPVLLVDPVPLVERRHVDLLRVNSALCRLF